MSSQETYFYELTNLFHFYITSLLIFNVKTLTLNINQKFVKDLLALSCYQLELLVFHCNLRKFAHIILISYFFVFSVVRYTKHSMANCIVYLKQIHRIQPQLRDNIHRKSLFFHYCLSRIQYENPFFSLNVLLTVIAQLLYTSWFYHRHCQSKW